LPGKRRTKLPFPINLIFNVKAFYVFFIVVMIASMAAVGLGAGLGAGQVEPAPIDDPLDPDDEPPDNVFPEPLPVIDGTVPHIATLITNQGEITIELSTDAPQTANSFAFLAGKGFYHNTAFFYVDHNFFAQAGDPTCRTDAESVCTGLGGPGYVLPLENEEGQHVRWAVVAPTLAEGGHEIHGSQFRILLQDDDRLDGRETVFGHVVEGQEVLENTPNFRACSVVTSPDCQHNLEDALIILDVIVEEA
jgi:peptidyl-prolyl cis-trans isomerase-like 3